MQKPILFNPKTCLVLTLALAGVSLLLPLALPQTRGTAFNYFASASLTCLVLGCCLSLAVNRLVVSRLCVRFPEWRKELDRYAMGRFFRLRGPKADKVVERLIRDDPACAQILHERRQVLVYSTLWTYVPTGLVLLFIISLL